MASKIIKDPNSLLQWWDEYKATIDKSPDIQQVATIKGSVEMKVKKPYLYAGFVSYVYRKYGIYIRQYIYNEGGRYGDFVEVATCIRSEWEADQIEGSLTGRYKAANLVARLNGIQDKTQTEHSGEIKLPTINLIMPKDAD